MTDATFRTKSETAGVADRAGKGKTPDMQPNVEVEKPYLDDERPYEVEYFKLDETLWNNPEGGFEAEIGTIRDYFQGEIEKGKLANNRKTIRKELDKMVKLTNMKDETRTVVKIATVAAHINFLNDTGSIMSDFAKYGNN